MKFGPPWFPENINKNLLKSSFPDESFSGNILFFNQEIFYHTKKSVKVLYLAPGLPLGGYLERQY